MIPSRIKACIVVIDDTKKDQAYYIGYDFALHLAGKSKSDPLRLQPETAVWLAEQLEDQADKPYYRHYKVMPVEDA